MEPARDLGVVAVSPNEMLTLTIALPFPRGRGEVFAGAILTARVQG